MEQNRRSINHQTVLTRLSAMRPEQDHESQYALNNQSSADNQNKSLEMRRVKNSFNGRRSQQYGAKSASQDQRSKNCSAVKNQKKHRSQAVDRDTSCNGRAFGITRVLLGIFHHREPSPR